MSGDYQPSNGADDPLARALTGAMDEFTRRRTPRRFDATGMIRKARRRTWTIATAAAAAVLLVSGGAFAVTTAVRGSGRTPVTVDSSTSPTPSPSTPAATTTSASPAPGAPLSRTEVATAISVAAAVYGDFEVFNLDGHKYNTATHFVSPAAYTAAWGSGKAPGAAMACGAKFQGSVIGDPMLSGSTVTVPVQLFSKSTAAPKQAIVTLDRASLKVSGISCHTGKTLPGTAGERAARTALVSYYGPYLAGAGGSLTKWLTPAFQNGPHGHDTMDQFNRMTCSQDEPTVWVVGRIVTSGDTATAALRLYGNTVTVTIDLNRTRIAFVDCVPMPPVPHPSGTASITAAQTYLVRFFEGYEMAWGWRALHPVKPMLSGYFAPGVLEGSWTAAGGLLPAGCTTSAPYVDAYVTEGSGHKNGATATFGLTLFDVDANEIGTGSMTIDLNTLIISGFGCG